jgi:anthranilate phosphoribosyltransferase
MTSGALSEALATLAERRDLTPDQMQEAMRALMRGEGGEAETAAFLTALRVKGESPAELAAAVEILREHMVPLDAGGREVVDTCGTGGDGQGTFNISTAAALVVAGCGVHVVKHGNRGVSSASGSADVFAALGVKIDPEPRVVQRCLEDAGFAFCFAPRFHPAMRHVAEVRKRLRFRTIFNLAGPLCNPARVRHQLLGVGRPELLDLMADCLGRIGTKSAFVIHATDGLDEVSLGAPTAWRSAGVERPKQAGFWGPEEFGLGACNTAELRVGSPVESAGHIREVLAGKQGPHRDAVLANAAVALMTVRPLALPEAVNLAAEAVDRGRAQQVLERLVAGSQRD